MINLLIFGIIGLLIFFLVVYLNLWRQSKKYGWLEKKALYQDTPKTPGEVLYSKKLPLCGKPDYLIKYNKMIIPIEVKSGRTPTKPHPSHIMQLTSYCVLIEENFKQRPQFGIIKYPEAEYEIDFDQEHEDELKRLIYQMIDYKNHDLEFNIDLDDWKICKNCRAEISNRSVI